jgi:membrane protease YdiL (CAAX protease family)
MLLPFIALFAAESFIRTVPAPGNRDLGTFLGSDVGQSFLDGAWGWFGLIIAMQILNTVLGEELLFRGFLLPRMNRAFGRADWLVNGVLFAAYHLHMPWVIPTTLLDSFTLAYPSKRYRSAWMGIAVHSSQSVFFAIIILLLVL